MFDIAALEKFYALVSLAGGAPVQQISGELKALFTQSRSETDLNNFRLGKKPWKKLSDEICPVLRFLAMNEMTVGNICFPLDDQVPDCWYWPDSDQKKIGIEVTFAMGRERVELAKDMIEKGIGAGFIGLPDDVSQASFDAARTRGRVMFSADQAIAATKSGILSCSSKKNKPKYEGMILLVQAPMSALPRERWSPMITEIKPNALSLPFTSVYWIGNGDSKSEYFKLK